MRNLVLVAALAAAGCSMLQPAPQEKRAAAPAPQQPSLSSAQSMVDLAAVQRKLAGAGYYIGPTDGVWGPRSASAMSAWQRDNNLPATGHPDDAALDRMDLRREPTP